MKSLADMLDAARRELAMRRSAYPKWVAGGRMSQAKADHEIACMEGIVERLEMLKLLAEVSAEIIREEEAKKQT